MSLVIMVILIALLVGILSKGERPADIHTEEDQTPSVSTVDSSSPKEPLRVVLEDAPTDDIRWSTEIFFDKNDPKDWHQYHGQKRVKKLVQLKLDVLEDLEQLKLMFVARRGTGKTTIFRIIGNKLLNRRQSKYIEITPAMVKTKAKLDALMSELGTNDILCIDEIHMFSRQVADTLLPAIEDNIYPFEEGMRKLPEGICWIGATTDVGLLPEAFQDRFHIIALEDLSEEDLKNILQDMDFPIEESAAKEIAKRSVGSPRELKRVYGVCKDVSKFNGSEVINTFTCEKTFNLLDLDTNGLYSHDRKVLEALYNNPKYYAERADGTRPKRYAHSERAIRALTGLDEALYRDQIEPKLLKLGFITIGTGGRELTEKTFETYFKDN